MPRKGRQSKAKWPRLKGGLRIGIFGGSFDPPHVGHLIIAEQAREQLRLDKVLFIPAHVPPHKLRGATATAPLRLKMVRMAVKGNPAFTVSDRELRRSGVSYTVETLRSLKTRYPRARLILIVGSDNLEEFFSWRSPKEILQMSTLAVYRRPGFSQRFMKRFQLKQIRVLKGVLLDISSTEIRRKLARGGSIRYLVPDQVRTFLISRKLYR